MYYDFQELLQNIMEGFSSVVPYDIKTGQDLQKLCIILYMFSVFVLMYLFKDVEGYDSTI